MKGHGPPTTVLLCDDSRTYSEALRRFLEHDGDLRVVATCGTGEDAVDRLARLEPDLVVVDLELPRADGIETIRRMMQVHPVPILLLSASAARGSGRATEAIAAGALDAVWKRDVPITDVAGVRAIAFRRYIKRLATARVATDRATATVRAPRKGRQPRREAAVIGIAASTGGPVALREVLGALPRDFAVPVLVVQHIASGFLKGLVDWLAGQVAIPVGLARAGRTPKPGVWFAPDDAHLVLDERGCLRLDTDTVVGYHRPAADLLLSSLAQSHGASAAAVVLTGMGSDGAYGLGAVAAAGGMTVAQDRETSAIYGMPRAAATHGAEMVLPLQSIGPTLARLQKAQ